MIDKVKLLDAVHDNINVPGLLNVALDDVLEPLLDKVVADTTNPFDNIAKAAVYPVLEKGIKEAVQKLWDSLNAPQA